MHYEILTKYEIDVPIYDSRFNRQHQHISANHYQFMDIDKVSKDYWYAVT